MKNDVSARRGFLQSVGRVTGFAGLLAASHGSAAQGVAPVERRNIYDIRSFGARGDGKGLDTAAINRAIAAATAAGGGTIVFPAGTYLSYSLRLQSNIGLHLEHGCTLIAACISFVLTLSARASSTAFP